MKSLGRCEMILKVLSITTFFAGRRNGRLWTGHSSEVGRGDGVETPHLMRQEKGELDRL